MKHIKGNRSRSLLTRVDAEDIQSNAVDLKIDKVFCKSGIFQISNNSKLHRSTVELLTDPDDYWTLSPGTYEVVMENIIQVGADEAGFVITRSTLNRNGVFLTSGLYDSGYHGVMAAAMHVTIDTMLIKKGTRIGQFLLFDAEMLHKYSGSYGIGSEHDKKYE